RYIWIDSLCIVQDDEEDWRRESAKNSTTYLDSYLTLAVTKSKNCTGGLFSRYSHRKFCGVDLKGWPFTLYCRQKLLHWELRNKICSDPDEDEDELYDSHFPLLRSAYVYQERLLSPRVLHFGAEELLWECMEETRCK
ncbi:hypothetical protein B0T26DRAFT_600750, partial [Lasiosphaeria miniovina]